MAVAVARAALARAAVVTARAVARATDHRKFGFDMASIREGADGRCQNLTLVVPIWVQKAMSRFLARCSAVSGWPALAGTYPVRGVNECVKERGIKSREGS